MIFTKVSLGAFLLTISFLIATALCFDIVDIMTTHTWTQAVADASSDAGANKRYFNLGTYSDEFLIDPVPAETVARATFDKNIQNLQAMGISTEKIDLPVISFPDNYSISVDVDLSYELGFSERMMDNIFADDHTYGDIQDSIHSTSNINHKK